MYVIRLSVKANHMESDPFAIKQCVIVVMKRDSASEKNKTIQIRVISAYHVNIR